MKNKILIIIVIILVSCDTKNKSNLTEKNKEILEIKTENPIVTENHYKEKNTNTWQFGFGLTHDIDKDSIWKKPVRYYIENKNCSQTAIDFYFGKYRPTDEEKTEKLLGFVLTENLELRPFYRWILNKTILIQDGALGEYTGLPARKYAEKYPYEFFEYIDSDKSNKKYENWCNSIKYSGFYDKIDLKNPKSMSSDIEKTMIKNCKDCNKIILKRIKKFAIDCVPESE
jgi:hypothetical protein